MKKISILLMCVLIFPLMAAEASQESLARRFFRLNTPEQSLKDSLEGQLDLLAPYLNLQPDTEKGSAERHSEMESIRSVLDLFLGEDFSYAELEEISLPIILSQYSASELEAIIAFLESPAGKAFQNNSRLESNYLAQAVKIYFDRKAQDQDFLLRMIMAMFEKLGSEEGYVDDLGSVPLDAWNWEMPSAPDTIEAAPWDDWTEENVPDTLAYEYTPDSWEDYWNGPVPITITMNGRFMDRVEEIAYVFNQVLPAFAQIYRWLNDYVEEYGGYPFELDWSQISAVPGYDLVYDHDGAFIEAKSRSDHNLPGVEIIYYLNENSVWISVPAKNGN